MLNLQNISYSHANKSLLFNDISLNVNPQDKIALIGNNGSGKSTLLKIIAGELQANKGHIHLNCQPYYLPQHFGQYNHFTVVQALSVQDKLHALSEILRGELNEKNYATLNEDWTIEEKCAQALEYWKLSDLGLSQPFSTLSGGEKTKVFLAGLMIHQPEFMLLDEPSNHLDAEGRKLLYDYISNSSAGLLIVSHDRTLLNLMNMVCELDKNGIVSYGGNYNFYQAQKQNALLALQQDVQSREKALKKARDTQKESIARQQRKDSRGKGKQEKAGVARIMMNTLQNKAEKSGAKLKEVHAGKIGTISSELQTLRSSLPDFDQMKFGFEHSAIHKGKCLVSANQVNHRLGDGLLWREAINLQIYSGARIAIKGKNGSGKTTLIGMILGQIIPSSGTIDISPVQKVYIDQEYSLIDNHCSVFEQIQRRNTGALAEHELKIRLSRFLFSKEDWDKPCAALSGGEKMRLSLCCLTLSGHSPDLVILDEPTNNLDIQNIEILTAAINQYLGTLIVVSHDSSFLDALGIDEIIQL